MTNRHVEEAVERKIVASEGHRRAGDRLFAARASIREAFGELGLADWDLDDLEVYLAGSPGFLTIDDDQQWKVIGLVAGSIITAVEQVRSDHEATLTTERERRERAEEALEATASKELTPQERKAEEDAITKIIARREETAERDRLTPRMEAHDILKFIELSRKGLLPNSAALSQPKEEER